MAAILSRPQCDNRANDLERLFHETSPAELDAYM